MATIIFTNLDPFPIAVFAPNIPPAKFAAAIIKASVQIMEPVIEKIITAPKFVAKLTTLAPALAAKYCLPNAPTNKAIKKAPVPGPNAPS